MVVLRALCEKNVIFNLRASENIIHKLFEIVHFSHCEALRNGASLGNETGSDRTIVADAQNHDVKSSESRGDVKLNYSELFDLHAVIR
jgi:hypothetical protein